MNSFDTDLIALCATAGRKIAIITDRQEKSNDIGDAVCDAAGANIRRRRKTNGDEGIEFKSGGSVFLMSRRGPNRVRGRSFDMIVIDDHRYLQDEAFMEAIIPCFADAPAGRPRIGVLVI